MTLWAITLLVVILAGARSGSLPHHGRYRGTLTTTSSNRELGGQVTYTRCGNLLHVWLADTVVRDLSMEFGTSVPSLRPRSFQAQPIDLLSPLQSRVTGLQGYFRLYIPLDTIFFADSGSMRFTTFDRGEIAGQFRYTLSQGWAGRPQLIAAVVGTFRAARDTVTERTVYRGARCDHPGAEWPHQGRH